MAKHQYATKPPSISTMPPGVPYIIGNEAAERFSFYGMRSILTVFMTAYLVNKMGELSPMGDAEARAWFATFVSAVYFLPILGAILAEGFLGKYNTILWLSIVYCLGHLALAFMDTAWGIGFGQEKVLAIGLGLIALGSGGIKPCVSANVGDQFGDSNKHLLSKVFGWFYFSINAGSFISTILCPLMLANPNWGPRWAFGIPGVAMFIATIFFWAGRKKFVHIPPAGWDFVKQMFSKEGLGALGRLVIVYVFVAVFWSLWDQSSGGSWTLQARNMDLSFFGMQLLPAQVQTANPILILLFIPLVNYLIYPALDKFFPLTPLRKIGIGLFLTAFSFLVIAYVQSMIDAGQRPTIWWQFLAYVILTLGETMVSITGLELSYTQAPNKMKSAVMAAWLFTVSLGNAFTAGVNFVISNPDGSSKMSDYNYYLFFAGLMLVATAFFAVVAKFYRYRTYLQSQEPTEDERATEPTLAGGAPT
ncbi:MAG TPA: POT family MFS transporter [Chthoniobacterales bacterium]|nr:POT family MFS transporter [Chthoniobacterales bacterium]